MRWLLVLSVPLLLAGSVRRIGIYHGGGTYIWHPDVPKQLWVARKHQRGVLDMRTMYKGDMELTMYPYGTALLTSHAISQWEDVSGEDWTVRNQWEWAVAMRYLSTAFALAGLACLLIALYRLLGPFPTLITGLLLGLEPLNNQLSHYGMNDVPLNTILLLTWLCATRVPSEPRRFPCFSLLAGALLGLGFGIKYQAVLGGALMAVAWFMSWRQKGIPGLAASVVVCGLAAVVGALVTTPLLLEDPVYFFRHLPDFLRWQANITYVDLPFTTKALRNAEYLGRLCLQGGQWLLLPAAGLAVAGLRGQRLAPALRVLVVSGLVFSALLALALITSRDFVRPNDVLPFSTTLIVLAGVGLSQLARHAPAVPPAWRLAGGVALAAVVVWFASVAFQDSLALQRTDTRLLAHDWCQDHIPAGAVVRREYYVLPVHKEGVIEREHNSFADADVLRVLQEGHYDYLIVSSFSYERFFVDFMPHQGSDAQKCYAWIRDNNELVAEFSDREMLHAHPVITIYRKRAATPPVDR
jgi:hypothetical protein